jgi:hypothetical protein
MGGSRFNMNISPPHRRKQLWNFSLQIKSNPKTPLCNTAHSPQYKRPSPNDKDTYWQVFNFIHHCILLISIQWKLLIMITLGPALFDNNQLITLSRVYKNLHYLTQFIVPAFFMYFYSVCSELRLPYPFAVEFSLSSLL